VSCTRLPTALDHFKQLNDVFGHGAGDRALRAFSQVLRDSLRRADGPCRFGGEEFVIVLPSCQADEAVQVLERVRQRLAERLATGQLPVFTVSFGVASSDQGSEFQEIVDLADQALLRAKGGGRDQIVVATEENGLTVGQLSGSAVVTYDPNSPSRYAPPAPVCWPGRSSRMQWSP